MKRIAERMYTIFMSICARLIKGVPTSRSLKKIYDYLGFGVAGLWLVRQARHRDWRWLMRSEMRWPLRGLEALKAGVLDVIAWWEIYRVIKAFYIVFAFLLIYLRGTSAILGLTVLEQAMPWWLLVGLIGAVILILEVGQPVVVYFAALLPMWLYSLALVYGALYRQFPLVSLLSAVYLGFGCLGFVAGFYGAWRVRCLIERVKRLEAALDAHQLAMQEGSDGQPA